MTAGADPREVLRVRHVPPAQGRRRVRVRARAPARRNRALRHRRPRPARSIVAKDKRITVKHVREIEAAGIKHISRAGRVPARPRARAQRRRHRHRRSRRQRQRRDHRRAAGEAARSRASTRSRRIYTNDLDQGAVHLADAAHRRHRRPDGGAASRSTA